MVTVTDDDGATGSDTTTVTVVVSNKLLTANAGGPYFGYVNESIVFNGTNSYDPDDTITNYTWDFGDETNGVGKSPIHTYTEIGTYFVKLIVIDDNNRIDINTTRVIITIPDRPPSAPEITVKESEDDTYTYAFTAVSIDPDGDDIRYISDWDDGENSTSPDFPSNTTLTIYHTWKEPGNYTVKIYAEDTRNKTSDTI